MNRIKSEQRASVNVRSQAIVAQDCHGGNIFVEGVEKYKR